MSDEKFEEFLQREAKAYNEPPASVPRDEMWAAIAEGRARRAVAAPMATAAPRRGLVLRYAPWIGMAATLALGIGIGRFVDRDGGVAFHEGTQVASDSRSASDTAVGGSVGATDPTALTPAARGGSSLDVARDAQPAPRQVASNPSPRDVSVLPSATPNGTSTNGAVDGAYGVASQRHLASAEALISVVTATPRDALMDSLTTKWSREMLSNTRLLLDSPAGDDPVRRRLLEDLETLLVQLVQRSGGAVDERELIDRTLQRTQLLTRLRSNAAGT